MHTIRTNLRDASKIYLPIPFTVGYFVFHLKQAKLLDQVNGGNNNYA